MNGYIKNQTQEQRILDILKAEPGAWIDGMVFLRLYTPITQYHARIWGLQQKGYNIEGRWVFGKRWKEYRLLSKPQPLKLFQQIVHKHADLQHPGS